MKQLYITLIFFSLINNILGATHKNKTELPPSANISATGSPVCQNGTSPVVTFTGAGGTAPYVFTYRINGGANLTATTTSGNSISLSVPTTSAGTFTYQLVSVNDAANIPQTAIGNVSIVINPQPDATLNCDQPNGLFNNIPVFKVCSNTVSDFIFTNGSTTTTSNTNYTISWGDNSPNFSSTSFTTPLTHNYGIGLWNLTYTISGNNGCSIVQPYIIFVGSNPAVSLGNPGNTDICNSNALTFPITGTGNNPPGTTYTVSFNDGSTPQIFNHPPPTDVTHTFLISSCGTTSSDGSNTYPNSFSANIVARNPCNVSSVGVVPIYVSTPPQASFTLPSTTVCTNSSVCLANTSIGNENNGTACVTNPKIIWSISPNTGFTITSGSLGNDFGSTNPNLWTVGSSSLCLSFTISGTYTITLQTANRCGIDNEVKTICVEAPLIPQFTLSQNNSCSPFAITPTNTTNVSNQCSPTVYTWNVSYAAGNCGTSPPATFYTNGTNQNSITPNFNFTTPGTYTISLTADNSSCSPATSATQTIVIKNPPAVVISPILTPCGVYTINPTIASVQSCGGTNTGHNWSFPGSNNPTSTNANPGTITYPGPGTYTITLTVTNECGVSNTATQTFTLSQAPTLFNTALSQSVCSNVPTTLVTLTGTTSASFPWTATALGVTGHQSSGTGSIPVQTLTTTGSASGTVTYTIVPTIGTCIGTSVSYVITVNPAPAVTTQPLPSTVCHGGSPTQLVVSISSSASSPQYQWYYNDTNTNVTSPSSHIVPGATNASYDPPSTTDGTRYYYCEITFSSGGCAKVVSQTANVTIVPLPNIVTQPSPSQNVCVGGQTQTPLSVSYTGGTGNVTYQWSVDNGAGFAPIPSSNNASYTPPVFTLAGTYIYQVTVSFTGNNCGTITSNTATIIVYPDPAIGTQPLVTQSECEGAASQPLVISASGGNGTITYQWFKVPSTILTGETNATFTPPTNIVGTQQYYCEVVQNATPGCQVRSDNATVIVNAAPSITSQPLPDTVCEGGTANALSIVHTAGVGVPTYEWFWNTVNQNTGGNSVPSSNSLSYTPPTNVVGVLHYYCVVTFPGSGGCSQIRSNTAAITVNPGATINLQPIPLQEVCTGTTLAAFNVSYTGGTGTANYSWYYNTANATTGGQLMQQGPSASYTPTNISTPGIYYYYAVINFSGSGCGAITSNVAAINVVADPVINLQPLSSQSLCQSVTALPLIVSASGGSGSFSYQWFQNSTNSTAGMPITGATSDTYTPDTSATGTLYYYCMVSQTGLGCEATTTIASVTVSQAPIFTVQPIADILCLGDSTPALTVAFSNGAGVPEYHWFYNTVASTIGATEIGTNSDTFAPSVSTPGTLYYYCIIRLPSGGCTEIVSDIASITVNQFPVIAAASDVICSGNLFTIAPETISGNIVPALTTYTWPQPIVIPSGTVNGAIAETSSQSIISQTLINTSINPSTVIYNVTPISNGCPGLPFSITVTVNPAISPNVTVNNNTCFGVNNASITTNITGGIPFSIGNPYLIVWTGPNSFTSNAPSISNIEPGTYTLSIQDAGGCPISNTYVITQPDDIIIAVDLEKDITCFGDADGAININVNGGTLPYGYTWTKNSNPFAFTEDIAALGPGIYTVSVTDINSCGPKTYTFTITEPQALSLSLTSQTNILCFGDATGAINISANGGIPIQITPGIFDYNYAWTGPAGFTSSIQNLTNLVAGTYDLTITDANGCEDNLSVSVTQNPEIIANVVTTPITCYGADNASITLNLSGGISPYVVNWSNLATGTFQDNLAAGTYNITITDALSCQKLIAVTIPQAPIFMVNPIVENISCFGAHDGSINLNLTGGIAPVVLTWSDGSTAGTSRNNLGPGTYSATISDGTPCYITRTFTIIEPQQLVLTANKIDAFDCNNANSGSINLLIAGGTAPFSFVWSNGATSEDLSAISAGNYQVTVTDANGCSKVESYTINRQPPIAIVVDTNTVFDCETRFIEQTFTANVSGGVPPYQLSWSSGTISGANNEIMHTNTNGTVIISVTDSFGCIATHSFDVDTPELGTVSFETASYAYSTYGLYSVSDPIQFTSSITGDYLNIAWNFGDGTVSTEVNPIHIYTSPGEYIITETVTYPFGCVYVHKISLLVEKGYVLELPDGFTPNDDGLNDTMRPVFKGMKTVRIDIYDTWGGFLFSEEGETLKGWDGRVKGIEVENGNYHCKVRATTFYNQTIEKSQPFTLIK